MNSDDKRPIGEAYYMLSRYGQKFNLNQVMNNEIEELTSKRRLELEKEGYDVENYDEQFDKLTNESMNKLKLVNDIRERERITLKYNEKKNKLAKEYLGIDLQLKVSV